ncbi:minor tail protein [Streptomyces phage BartholomewSD]|nr:minor tail protein [Streptomyces phage BartholomewSD]
MPNTYYPYDNGTVGPTGPEGPQGPAGPAGANGVVQSVNGQSVEAVVLDADDVGALPSNANATLNATYLGVSRPAGNYRVVRWMTDGTSRWEAQADDVAETGSGAGSDFRLAARNDDGSFNKTTVHAKRSDGTISFGTTVHHGSAQVTSSGSIGLRDVGTDPATTSGGVFIYSKSGKMFVKQADGTSFQIAQVSYPVTSVNGETGNVNLGAADVGALPATAGEVMQTLPINGAAGSSRTLTFRTNSVNRWTLAAGTDVETGTDAAGSNLSLASRNDDGSYRATVIDANRSTGQVAIGGSTKLSDAKLTVINGVGVINRTEDPAPPAQGFVMYAKNGLPYVIQSDGTIFQVGSGGGGTGGAVDSVNGKTGIVQLTAADVNALPVEGGTLTGPVNITPASGHGFTAYGSVDPATYFRVTDGGHPYSNSLRSTFYNLGVGDTTAPFGGGKFVLGFKNASIVPTETPTNGAVAYAEGGKLKVLQQDGTTVTVGAQAVSSVNGQTGAVVVDLDDLGGIPYSEKAAANGVASLDSAKRVPVAQLPDVAKPSDFAPTDLGLKAWSSDPAMCSVQVVYPTSGSGRVTAVKINEAVSVSKIVWYFKGYAGGLKTGSWAGIYNSSGTLMRATGDLSTAAYEPQEQHDTGGGNSWSNLTSAVTLQPGLYYVVFRMVYTESPVDGPAILAYDNSSACPSRLGVNNMWRWASLTTSASSAPSSISTSSFTGDPKRFWVGLA